MSDKYAVFGNPIAHSLSPLIHTFFAKTLNEDIEYGRVLVEEGCFVKEAEAFKASGGKGFNVTAPCKIDAFNYVDKLSDAAKTAGAVNTVKFTKDGILGDNTDGVGFISDLKRLKAKLEGASVLLIGAGGAANASRSVRRESRSGRSWPRSRAACRHNRNTGDTVARACGGVPFWIGRKSGEEGLTERAGGAIISSLHEMLKR